MSVALPPAPAQAPALVRILLDLVAQLVTDWLDTALHYDVGVCTDATDGSDRSTPGQAVVDLGTAQTGAAYTMARFSATTLLQQRVRVVQTTRTGYVVDDLL